MLFLFLSGRIRRYRLQLLPLHDMDGSDDDSDEEEEEREGEDREEKEPVFTVSKLSTSLIPRPPLTWKLNQKVVRVWCSSRGHSDLFLEYKFS